ncbi:hypothetical protein [Oryza sativa Japonica Group]|uniref:Uncharacterized protein n=1 Tax=Oryza sativa subsp. japonica TaxID=39947 RepID=Q5ZAM2_ORYSJ|nr:hypothetical protein [Oryza sativa Japonica Group]BAD53372.1 hypothetical protein [Oryza sativa Japonica Group]
MALQLQVVFTDNLRAFCPVSTSLSTTGATGRRGSGRNVGGITERRELDGSDRAAGVAGRRERWGGGTGGAAGARRER